MATNSSGNVKAAEALLAIGLRLPDTLQSVACKGTALESNTVTVRKKAFLFVRATEARLKLDASKKEVEALARKDPTHYAIGVGGWATIKFDEGEALPLARLEKWVGESYEIFGGLGTGAKSAKPRQKTAKKTGK